MPEQKATEAPTRRRPPLPKPDPLEEQLRLQKGLTPAQRDWLDKARTR
jgi:hypothetical protein